MIEELRELIAHWGTLGGFLFGVLIFIFYREVISTIQHRRSPFYKIVMAGSLTLKALSQRFGADYISRLCEDVRKPVLYLRGFRSDSSFSLRHSDLRSSEQVLATIFADTGPVITVGRPTEYLPLSGAIRLYFEDHEWKEKVAALISIASLVIIQPDLSESIEFELSTVMVNKKNQPSHLLFSFLGWQHLNKRQRREQYGSFKVAFKRISGIDLPVWRNGSYFLFFDSCWEPVLTAPNRSRAHLMWKNTKDPRVLSALLPFFNSMRAGSE
jgi:hypothetical protein